MGLFGRRLSVRDLTKAILICLPLSAAGLAVALAPGAQPWHTVGDALFAGAGGAAVGNAFAILQLRRKNRAGH
jgi:hypothetical protein